VRRIILLENELHCKLVILLILGVKQNEHYNEMQLLNGVKRIVMDW